jgi:hypothetical protein
MYELMYDVPLGIRLRNKEKRGRTVAACLTGSHCDRLKAGESVSGRLKRDYIPKSGSGDVGRLVERRRRGSSVSSGCRKRNAGSNVGQEVL